jgi:GTP-binding protein HflX
MPIVALVGYTNTGKSTLFRGLTNTDVLCADMPFATLDPTTRSVYLPSGRSVLLTDTVGFISQLPAFLKLAFQATLEEITNANLIIHVRDQSAPTSDAQKVAVLGVLAELKCHQPIIEVWNKADLVSPEEQEKTPGLWISAIHKTGLDALVQEIDGALSQEESFDSDEAALGLFLPD